jgi:Tc5 transposase DNA-binding domain
MTAPIDLAIEDLLSQPVPKFVATAEKYAVNITTLRRRFNGTQVSCRQAHELSHNRLTPVQEEVLIGWIDEFTEQRMPPTSQLVKNFAEELVGGPVRKN